MCPPRQKKAAEAPDPSEQATAEALSIGGNQDPAKPKGRSQVRTLPVNSALNIPSRASGLQI